MDNIRIKLEMQVLQFTSQPSQKSVKVDELYVMVTDKLTNFPAETRRRLQASFELRASGSIPSARA